MKKIGALCLIMSLALSMTACKKDDEVQGPTLEQVQAELLLAQNNISNLERELQGAKEVLATYNSSLSDVDLSSVTYLPTGQEAYTSINNKIRLSSNLTLEPSISLPNTTQINLGGNINYIPSNNWSFELSNNSLLLQHKNGMLVTLKVYQYIGSATPYDVADTIIRPHLSKLSTTETGVKKLFMNNSVVGSMVYNTMQVKDYKDSDIVEEYIEEPVVETEAVVDEVVQETNENGEIIENINESVDASGEDLISEEAQSPNSGFGSLDDSVTPTTQNESVSEESVSEEAISEETVAEVQNVQNLNDLVSESTAPVTNEIEVVESKELDYTIDSYNYNVGVIFSGDYALSIEVFYKNDENASIQQELLNSCLSSITINSQKLISE